MNRYYDPEVGRFINPDGYVSTGQGILGNNMFAYCGNNPVNFSDYSGSFPVLAIACIVSVFFVPILSVLEPIFDDDENTKSEYSGELYTSNKLENDIFFEERLFWYDVEKYVSDEANVGTVEVSCGALQTERDLDAVEVDYGIAKVSASTATNVNEGIGVSVVFEGAYASAFYIIPILEHVLKIGFTGNIGAYGFIAKIGTNGIEFGISSGIGGKFSVKWC